MDEVIGIERGTVVAASVSWTVLGGIGVRVDGADVGLTPQSRFVLARLLRRPGHPVPVEQLCRRDDAMGYGPAPDPASAGETTVDDRAIAAARVAVSRLRQALAGVAAVSSTPAGYVLDVDPQSVDHVAFEKAVRDARATEWPATAKHLVEHALGLWVGPPFGEWRDDAALALDAHALEELHRSAVDLWCSLVTQTGLHADELDRLERATLDEPLREQRWVALMLAHYRSGNQTEAVRTYERAREVLVEQVGIEPGSALRTMLQRVLDQDPRLEWRPQRMRAQPTALVSLDTAAVVVGREGDVGDVLSMLDRHRVVTIVGLGGIGKSALAGEIARAVTRSAWIVPLADLHDSARILRSIARSIGISPRIAGHSLAGAVADHLESVAGLLVLDNCEHVEAEVTELVMQLTASAPGARVLATSRVELAVAGGVIYRLGPLSVGSIDAPGPAALIVADHASIGRSSMALRWPEIAALCARAEGIPLALQLLGAATTSRVEGDGLGDAVSVAVQTAIDSLPDESRSLVMMLAALPAATRIELLVEISGRPEAEVRRALGFAVRGSLVVQRGGDQRAMIRVIEPARDVLRPKVRDDRHIVSAVRDAVLRLARAARSDLVDRTDFELATLLDDEHATVEWLLPRISPDDRLDVASALAPIWRSAGRTGFGTEILEGLEKQARSADPARRARYWVMRAQMTPSAANRVPFLAEIEDAVAVAAELGLIDLELRARGELALGYGWSGRFEAAVEQTKVLRARCPEGNEWAALSLASLVALGQAVVGDVSGASDAMLEVSVGHQQHGDIDEAMWSAAMAAAFAREAGDVARVRRALAIADAHEPTRFTRFSHALLLYERAQLAAFEGRPEAGPRFFDALGALTKVAEPRHVAACRRDLGIWRIEHADRGGIGDLAVATQVLVAEDPRQAVQGLDALAEVLVGEARLADAELLRAASALLARRSPLDEVVSIEADAELLAGAGRILQDLVDT